MASIQINGDTSGAITLAAPAVAGSNTLTLPTQTATLLTDSSAALNIGSGQIYKDASGNLGVGIVSGGGTLTNRLDLWTASVSGGVAVGATFVNPAANVNASGVEIRLSGTSVPTRYAGIQALITDGVNGHSLLFSTNTVGAAPTEKMRIDSSGNVGIGTTSLSNKLTVNGSAVLLANGQMKFADAANIYVATIQNSGASSTSQLEFLTGTTPTERMRIDSSGNLLVGVNSATANGGILQLSSGITFPAAQVAASNVNTLDDYEEGTFTPTVRGTTVVGTATYTEQTGRYTKIGNRVFFSIAMTYSGGTGTGNIELGGLPFTSTNFSVACSVFASSLALTASNVVQAAVDNSSTTVALRQYPVGGGAMASVAYDAAAFISVGGHYEV